MRRTTAVFGAVLAVAALYRITGPMRSPDRTVTEAPQVARGDSDARPVRRVHPDAPRSAEIFYAITSGGGDRWPAPATTEIYALDVASRASRRVFSDARQPFVIQVPLRGGIPPTLIVSAGVRLFAPAFIRGALPSGSRLDPSRFYELSTDGSDSARELFVVRGDQALPRNVFVSPDGDKLGYINDIRAQWFVFIHDTDTGTLLDSIPLQPTLLDGFARNIGWMPDGQRVFLTDETGDVHVTSAESEGRVGTYVMSADGSDVRHLPPAVDTATKRPGFYSDPQTPPTMLGSMPDGRYLFAELQWARQPSGTATFYQLVDPDTRERTDITPARATAGTGAFLWSKLSPDGALLAFSEIDQDHGRELLRILDILDGEVRTVLTHPILASAYPVLTVVGW